MSERDHDEARARRETAAMWLTRREAGWSANEAAAFSLWRAADPRHEAALCEIEETQRLLTHLPSSPAAAALLEEVDELIDVRTRQRVTPIGSWLKIAGALAAAACVAFAVWTATSRSPLAAPMSVSYAAVADQPRTIALADGSTLLLNGGGEVEVDFEPAERRLQLHRGEAHFTVAKDAARPFIVSAGTIKVRAVGTAFNVKRDQVAVDVVVTAGKVRVSRDGSTGGELFLTAGERAAIATEAAAPWPAVATLAPEALRDHLAWQAPRLEFANTPLAEAVVLFNRHSRVQLEIGDAELSARPIGGTFLANNSEAFVNLLLASGDVRVERVTETRLVLRKAR